jgi:hypothetical protein
MQMHKTPLRAVNLRVTFWCLSFSKKPMQRFDEFLPKNLKSGPIEKMHEKGP